MTENGRPKFNQLNPLEALERLSSDGQTFLDISALLATHNRGAPQLSIDEQIKWAAKIEGLTADRFTYVGEREDLLRELCPLTPLGTVADLRHDILWVDGKSDDEEAVNRILTLANIESAASPHMANFIKYRAPGGEIFPLRPEKSDTPWEDIVGEWVEDIFTRPEGFTREALVQLGDQIRAAYKYEKQELLNMCGGTIEESSAKFIFSFHFEPLSPGHTSHCCGAHGNDVHRSIMSALAQAALFAWATDGKKSVSIKARRTAYEKIPAAILDIEGDDADAFIRSLFADGKIPPNRDRMLEAGGAMFKGLNDRPPVELIFNAISKSNEAFKDDSAQDMWIQYVTGLVSCADDRLPAGATLQGELYVPNIPRHVSPAMYVSIGRRALNILNNQESPPAVYRSTLAAGIQNVNLNNIDFVEEQLLYDVPLIVKNVMSKSDTTKYIYTDVVVGAERWQKNPHGTEDVPYYPDTMLILQNKVVREKFHEQFGVDSRVHISELSEKEVKQCIMLHEQMVFERLNDAVTKKLKTALESDPSERSRLFLYLRVIRAHTRNIESQRLIVNSVS